MKIIAKRPFISSRRDVGNVPPGRILDIDDNYAKSLIKAGLAEEYSAAPVLRVDNKPSFISPVGANAENGSLSQADQVSRVQTVKKSRDGAARKARTVR